MKFIRQDYFLTRSSLVFFKIKLTLLLSTNGVSGVTSEPALTSRSIDVF